VGIPLCGLVPFVDRSPHLEMALSFLNPDTAFSLVMEADYIKASKMFWWLNGVLHGLCWLLLGIASFIVPRSWQDNPPGAKKQRWRERWHRWSYGDAGERLAFRKRLLDINAFYWLAGRARLKPMHVWAVFFVLACLWMWGALELGKDWLNEGIYLLTGLVLNSTLKIWVTSEAGRRLGEDRKIGALELLLSTPLSVPDILRGQILALKRQFLAPVLMTLMVEVVFLVASIQGEHADPQEVAYTASFAIILMVTLVADVVALALVAMWVSLTAKNPNRTTGITIRRVLVLPWVINFVLGLLAYGVSSLTQGNGNGYTKFILGLYFFSGIIADLLFGLTAWQRLNSELREVATQRFSAAPSWLKLLVNREKYAPSPPTVTSP
jgi:hypothetical protein